MTVRHEEQTLYLEGDCRVEEAETLAAILAGPGSWTVDLTLCRHLHSALVQTLLRFRPSIQGSPDRPFLRDFLAPALSRQTELS